MTSVHSPPSEKNTYDDISFQKRRKLIYLINQRKWTIPSAAKELGIKVCTAKYILYLFRKRGKIYSKKGQGSLAFQQALNVEERELGNFTYVPIPVPVYLFCWYPGNQMPINLVHDQLA